MEDKKEDFSLTRTVNHNRVLKIAKKKKKKCVSALKDYNDDHF